MNSPFVYMLKQNNKVFLFDVNTNMISRINERIYKCFNEEDYENLEPEDRELINNMKNSGMLRPNQLEKIEHPMTDFVENMIGDNLSRLTLQVTQNCNFRCNYCVYSGSYHNRTHNNKRMDIDTARAALDFLCAHSQNSADINVSFYGGEPLLEMELIKECVKYSRVIFQRKHLSFNLTTNASLLTDEIIKYLEKESVLLTISLDGPKEIHDKNRHFADGKKGTYDVVIEKIQRIHEIAPNYISNITINTVLDDENDFLTIKRFFSENPVVKDIFISTNYINDVNRKDKIDHSNEKNYIEICNEKFIGMMFLLKRVSREYVSQLIIREISDIEEKMFKRKISKGMFQPITHPGGPCLPGLQRPFVNAYGKIFPCERVNETCKEMCIGNIYDGFDIRAIKELLNIGKITESACKKCWAFNYCTQCAVMADDGEKISARERLEKCERIRNHIDGLLRDYIVLKECGCDFTQTI